MAATRSSDERWERSEGQVRIATHVTLVPGQRRPILVLEGFHDPALELEELRVRDDTRGIIGGVRVEGDRIRFERTRRGRTRVPPMEIVFDDATGRVGSYRGRVPPRGPNGRALTADIRYASAAAARERPVSLARTRTAT